MAPQTPSVFPVGQPDSAGIPPVIQDLVLLAPFNDAARAEQMIRENANDLAAVMVEPLQRVLLPVPGFLETLRRVTRELGIVLVFDEVVTGFRIAWGGAQERYGVVPDLATYGKAMAGGFPMAVFTGRSDVMQFLDSRRTQPGKKVWAGGTLNGNPIGAAAGIACLNVLSRPGTYEHVHELGGRLRTGITSIGARHGFTVQALGEDAVFGVRFLDNPEPRDWADLLASDRELGLRWSIELMKRGILVNPNEKFYISVAHTVEDIDRTLDAVEGAFAAIAAA
jgi:glutamate-1-semialdehyde 2,1-aminomutase